MSPEFIIFILATLFGIFVYWRESRNNYLFRFFDKLTHTKELQMKSTIKKGFLFNQPLVYRIIYIVLFYVVFYIILNFLKLIPIGGIVFFINLVLGTILGTYIASLIVKANDTIADSHDVIEDTLEKGKGFLNDIADDVKEKTKSVKEKIEDTFDKDDDTDTKDKTNKDQSEKSGRDRLKDKGLL